MSCSMRNTKKAPAIPGNAAKREPDKGHNNKSKSELCFPIVETFKPKPEPPMSDEKVPKTRSNAL